ADLARDLDDAMRLEPEHLSCYELEAKPGTRFSHHYGAELERQAEAMEGYFEQVVMTLTRAEYRWYETANFCRRPGAPGGRDLRSRHNLAYWLGRDYLGLGMGAVSTVGGLRWRNAPRLRPYLGALAAGETPPREFERLPRAVRGRERLLLGLRLDEGVQVAAVDGALDRDALARLERHGLARVRAAAGEAERLELTPRGRFLGGGVSAELLAYHSPE
ncbi:MAG: coproporphyrinogen III oxidase, partial [Gaiellaceae bacterium]